MRRDDYYPQPHTTIMGQCPYCNAHIAIGRGSRTVKDVLFDDCHNCRHGQTGARITAFVCTNSACREMVINLEWCEAVIMNGMPGQQTHGHLVRPVERYRVRPRGRTRTAPDCVPPAIAEDYKEAYATIDASPKASATLSRRCLEAMIKDFWKIEKRNLYEAIIALPDEKVDPDTRKAIDAVRVYGNIGAHMKTASDKIASVTKEEAARVFDLIGILFEDWYIARDRRQKAVKALADRKDEPMR